MQLAERMGQLPMRCVPLDSNLRPAVAAAHYGEVSNLGDGCAFVGKGTSEIELTYCGIVSNGKKSKASRKLPVGIIARSMLSGTDLLYCILRQATC